MKRTILKKLSLVVVCAMLVLLFQGNSLASSNVAAGRAYLESIGFTPEVLDTYSDELILELYGDYRDEDAVCVSSEEVFLMENDQETAMGPMAIIPSSQITFTISLVKTLTQLSSTVPISKIDQVEVVISYQWVYNKPEFKGTDAIVVNWSDTDFRLYVESGRHFRGESYYKTVEGTKYVTFSETNYDGAVNNLGALGWEFQLGTCDYVTRYGSGRILLKPRYTMYYHEDQANLDESVNFNAIYYHAKGALVPSLSASATGVSVGVGYAEQTDTRSLDHEFYYAR